MNTFPSHKNSANERAARRANWKSDVQKQIDHQTATAAIVATFAGDGQKMLAAGLVSQSGNQFYIKARKGHYTVYRIAGEFKCDCKDTQRFGDCAHAHAAKLFDEANSASSNVIEFPKVMTTEEKPEDLDQIAANQALAIALLFADETTAGGIFNAHAKAERELRENNSVDFEIGILSFRSRGSGKDHEITAKGCSSRCEAFVAGRYCYHRAMFAILECRARLRAGSCEICDLCGKSSANGTIHSGCHDDEEFYAGKLAA